MSGRGQGECQGGVREGGQEGGQGGVFEIVYFQICISPWEEVRPR